MIKDKDDRFEINIQKIYLVPSLSSKNETLLLVIKNDVKKISKFSRPVHLCLRLQNQK